MNTLCYYGTLVIINDPILNTLLLSNIDISISLVFTQCPLSVLEPSMPHILVLREFLGLPLPLMLKFLTVLSNTSQCLLQEIPLGICLVFLMTEGPQSESIIFITSPTVNMTNACVDAAHLAEVVFTRFAPAAETPSRSSLHSLERSHQMQPTLQELNYAHLWCFLRVSSTSFIGGSSAGDSLSFLTFINIHYHVMNAHVLLWTSALCFGK